MQFRGVVEIFERRSVLFAETLQGDDIAMATRANELLRPPLGSLCPRRITMRDDPDGPAAQQFQRLGMQPGNR